MWRRMAPVTAPAARLHAARPLWGSRPHLHRCDTSMNASRLHFPGASRLWVSLAMSLTLGVPLACATPPPSGPSAYLPAEQGSLGDRDAERLYRQALAELEGGRYDDARESLQLLQSSLRDEPLAHAAELYIARAALGPAQERHALAGDAATSQALQSLEALASSPGISPSVQQAARLYLGWARTLRGDTAQARDALAGMRGPSPLNMVLSTDRIAVLTIAAESRTSLNQPEEAMADLEAMWQLVHAAPNGSATAQAYGPYVRARALRLAEFEMTDEALSRCASSAPGLTTSVCEWAFLKRQIAQGAMSTSTPAVLARWQASQARMQALGAGYRVHETLDPMAPTVADRPASQPVIGALVPLSGPSRAMGYRALAGMLLAQQSFQAESAPSSGVTLVIQDAYPDARAAFERLVAAGAQVVVGPLDVQASRDVAPLAAARTLPMVSLAPDTTQGGALLASPQAGRAPWVFRNGISVQAEAQAMARLAFETLKDRQVAVLAPSIPYGKTMSEAFIRAFKALGGEVVAEVVYERSQTDFVREARKVAESRPQAVFIADSGAKVAEVAAFLAQENLWGQQPGQAATTKGARRFVHYLGTSLWQDGATLRQASSYVQGALVPTWFSPLFASTASEAFVTSHQAVYDKGPEAFEAFGYDAVLQVRQLMEHSPGATPSAIRDSLLSQEPYLGLTGTYSFGANGEPARQLRFVTISGQGFAPTELQVGSGPAKPLAP